MEFPAAAALAGLGVDVGKPSVGLRTERVDKLGKSCAGALGFAACCALLLGCPVATMLRAEPPARDLILISIDTLRPDHLGVYGYGRATSPALDRLANEGVVFENARSTAPWTLPAHASLLTGLFPDRHGVLTRIDRLSEETPTLTARLAGSGFATAAIVNSIWLAPGHGLVRDFADYRRLPEDLSARGAAADITDAAIDWLARARSERRFLFLHYFDLHSEYRALPDYEALFTDGTTGIEASPALISDVRAGRRRLTADELEELRGDYDAGIRQLDDELARLFDWLREHGRFDETLLVVVSDHGEEFLEHGGLGHGHTHYEELLRVPLILRGPGLPQELRIAADVSLVDVMASALGALGVESRNAIDGVDLAPLWLEPERGLAERALFAASGGRTGEVTQSSLVLGRFKSIRDREVEDGRARLFDRMADPGETQDIALQQPVVARRYERALERSERGRSEAPHLASRDSAEEDRLRALGYAD